MMTLSSAYLLLLLLYTGVIDIGVVYAFVSPSSSSSSSLITTKIKDEHHPSSSYSSSSSSSSSCHDTQQKLYSSQRINQFKLSSLSSSSTNNQDDLDINNNSGMMLTNDTTNEDEVQPIIGNNWMKRSTSIDFMPSEMSSSKDDDTIYMDVGINGLTFGTGELSQRMHSALMKVAHTKYPNGDIPSELINVYLLYAMDASAKEAVKVALDSNGYTLNLGELEAMQDEGAWGQIDDVILIKNEKEEETSSSSKEEGSKYNSFMDAITQGSWTPGMPYSFIVREVPARKKAMDLEALLKALDPDGSLWEEAKEKGMLLPGDEITTLNELRVDCEQRVKSSPFEISNEYNVFRGGSSKGYNVISRKVLLKCCRNEDGTENQKSEFILKLCILTILTLTLWITQSKCSYFTIYFLHSSSLYANKALLHVMDSLANHGCLIVDLTNEDETTEDAITMGKMWDATSTFFHNVMLNDDNRESILPMQQAEGTGSSHAMVGFASFKNGDNQFLETRIRRSDGMLLPEETSSIIGQDGMKNMVDAFHIMSDVGKDIVRIVTAASSVEANAFVTTKGGSVTISGESESSPSIAGLSFEDATVSGILDEDSAPSKEDVKRAEILASEAAILLTDEIMDDGRVLQTKDIEHNEGPVSMSPHRMCRYSNDNNNSDDKSKKKKASSAEIFGAHTDTSFVTIVPAAQISGLEVFDEDSLQWYRPELNARKHAKELDPESKMDDQYPWHSRYLIVMPGELLQLTSRNNVPAAVHRVVATTDTPRLSAPVLLRARPGTKMNVERYMGSLDKADSLLLDSNGMTMEDIHNALQAQPKQ